MKPLPQFTEGFPLKVLLGLYCINRKRMYLNYFEEFKLFVDWLGPVSLPTSPDSSLEWYESNYEVQELAKILGTTQATVLNTLKGI